MYDVRYEPSAFASLRVVRAVQRLLPAAIEAVETHTGETVPPLTITIAGRPGMAMARLLGARQGRTRVRVAAGFWWQEVRGAAGAIGIASATRTDRVLIGLNGPALRRQPAEVWPTLVHELVHAVQANRAGRREELLAGLDHNLRIAAMPDGAADIADAIVAVEEAEAYAVQYALTGADGNDEFDRTAMLHRLVDAASRWEAAVTAAESVAADETWAEAA